MSIQSRLLKMVTVLFVCLIITGIMVLPGCSGSSGGVAIGDEAPDFQLKSFDGEIYALSDFKGSPVLLNFWATWCGPCLSEMPYLDEINSEWEDDGLVLLAVNVAESSSGVKAFVDSFGYSMRVLLDTAQTASKKFNITAIPTTYFIDEDGIIQDKVIGAFPDKATIEEYLNRLIYPENVQ